jgi:hypothetical protein
VNRRTLLIGDSALSLSAFAGGAFVLNQRRDAEAEAAAAATPTEDKPLLVRDYSPSFPPTRQSPLSSSLTLLARPAVHTTQWCRKSGGSSRRRSASCPAGSIRGYGITIDIDHGGGVVTRYAHLSEIAEDVRVGTRVKAGDEIGAVGATGLVSGPNLHYEVRVDGRPVDPKDQDALPEQEIATAADLDALATWRSETGFMPTTDEERG